MSIRVAMTTDGCRPSRIVRTSGTRTHGEVCVDWSALPDVVQAMITGLMTENEILNRRLTEMQDYANRQLERIRELEEKLKAER